ncbi:hypothetical protein DB346_13955 [Verrucomicrobia bacterium LW23]|nr:hypothetical protein DB346_13955 [Verrucomicrobia bacterium LW23]
MRHAIRDNIFAKTAGDREKSAFQQNLRFFLNGFHSPRRLNSYRTDPFLPAMHLPAPISCVPNEKSFAAYDISSGAIAKIYLMHNFRNFPVRKGLLFAINPLRVHTVPDAAWLADFC